MAYLGNRPAEAYSAFQKQDFSTSATTSYTLDHPVANQNEIALFINFVRQEPTAAYTASGTSLTLTSATSSSDDMYCVYLGKAVQTVNPPSGSVGSSQVASTIITGQTAETSIATDDTVLIHDTSAGALRKMTRANFVSGVGGANTPAFLVTMSTNPSIPNETFTKAPFNTEAYDTDNAFDSTTNYRFTVPTNEGGNYCFITKGAIDNLDNGEAIYTAFYINGTIDNHSYNTQWVSKSTNGFGYVNNVFVKNLSAGDYVEAYFSHNEGSAQNLSSSYTFFSGFKIIT